MVDGKLRYHVDQNNIHIEQYLAGLRLPGESLAVKIILTSLLPFAKDRFW
jgi:hypothetical protein